MGQTSEPRKFINMAALEWSPDYLVNRTDNVQTLKSNVACLDPKAGFHVLLEAGNRVGPRTMELLHATYKSGTLYVEEHA